MGKIPVTIPGIFKGILPIPMYPFMYSFYEISCFVCDFMELIPRETQYFPVNISTTENNK